MQLLSSLNWYLIYIDLTIYLHHANKLAWYWLIYCIFVALVVLVSDAFAAEELDWFVATMNSS